MSRIKNAFANNNKAFIAFLTAGDPSIDKTEEFIYKLIEGGADLIEIGIPFSDPIAEGAVIQSANIRSLSGGTRIKNVFELVARVRKNTQIPLVFLTYMNTVFKYGTEEFFRKCSETGIDGIIIPDLPFEEKGEIKEPANKYDVDIISLIAPTSENRIKLIAQESEGFVYVVSSMGVTGMRSEIKTDLKSITESVRKYTDNPIAIGFGINSPEQAEKYSKIADGVIVGSAIVKIIEQHRENSGEYLKEYANKMKSAMI
ncbi:MAG: tryptophan synthase subunit alpha [Oscillospiraceae bacterium]|nr:tryptophan synthase subunit alpha [Oscillospiraceae bacterium]